MALGARDCQSTDPKRRYLCPALSSCEAPAKVAEGPGQQNDDRAGAWLGVWAGVAAPAQVARLVRHRHGVMPAARQNVAIKDMEESGSGQLEVWSAFALE